MSKLISPEIAILFLVISSLTFALAVYHGFHFFRRLPAYYKKTIYGLAGSLLLLLLLFYAVIFLSDLNATCLACHAVNYPARPHLNISCLDCHQRPGFSGKTAFKIRQLKMFFSLKRYKLGSSLECIPDSTCLKCHQEIHKPLKAKNIKVSHAEFIGREKCISCHEAEVHAVFQQEKPVMEICLYCHQVSSSQKSCSKCHERKVTLSGYEKLLGLEHTAGFLTNHGGRSPNVCFACHQKNDCEECHQSFPHDRDFPAKHGSYALKNIYNCRSCHLIIKCNECHGTEMPHRKEWESLHGPKAVSDWNEVCTRCHTLNYCKKCHDEAFVDKFSSRVEKQ